MSHRDAGRGSGGDSRGHPRHHLEGDARGAQREGFLTAAAEDERIASLESHDVPARARVGEHQSLDLLLVRRLPAALLAHVAKLRVGPSAAQGFARNQPVVENDVGARNQLERARRHQSWIAGPGADEVDASLAPRAHSRIASTPTLRSRSATASPSATGSVPVRLSRTQSEPSSTPTKARSSSAPSPSDVACPPIGV